MKMKPVEGGEKHHIQSLLGQKIVDTEGDFTGGELLKDPKHNFFFDSESYLNFGHPEKKGLAAIQTRDDLFDLDHSKMKQDVHDNMKELTDEQREKMLPDQVARYMATRERINKDYDKIMDEINNYNPFDHRTQEILDTDYDNYMFLYSCKQHEEKVNSKGQSQAEIEQMKADDLDKKASVGVRAKESINMYLNTLGGNKKFVKFVHVLQ